MHFFCKVTKSSALCSKIRDPICSNLDRALKTLAKKKINKRPLIKTTTAEPTVMWNDAILRRENKTRGDRKSPAAMRWHKCTKYLALKWKIFSNSTPHTHSHTLFDISNSEVIRVTARNVLTNEDTLFLYYVCRMLLSSTKIAFCWWFFMNFLLYKLS